MKFSGCTLRWLTLFFLMPISASAATGILKARCTKTDSRMFFDAQLQLQVSQLCKLGHPPVRLLYSPQTGTISIVKKAKAVVLQRIPKGYGPEAIGQEGNISFLRPALQPYWNKNIVLYTVTRRTTSGNGSGQCGSGAEITLAAFDIVRFKDVGSQFLISSCSGSIELDDDDVQDGKLGGLSVTNHQLIIRFLGYKDKDGQVSALLSHDLKQLDFQ